MKKKMTTEQKIKGCLTRLQKLIVQWYKENGMPGEPLDETSIHCYGNATFGVSKGYDGRTFSIANLTVHKDDLHYKVISSPLDYKTLEEEEING